jgi:hypothetical protein
VKKAIFIDVSAAVVGGPAVVAGADVVAGMVVVAVVSDVSALPHPTTTNVTITASAAIHILLRAM